MKFAAWVAAITATALIAVELSMQPNGADRASFTALFVAAGVVTIGLGLTIPRVRALSRTVRWALSIPSLLAIGIAAATIIAATQLMFISPHDLKVVLATLGMGTGLAIVLSLQLSSGLQRDLEVIGQTADAVSQGDRSARAGLSRPDEVGDAARALDGMIGSVSESETAQRRLFASLGHDLRTPLTALRAAVETLEDGLVDDPQPYLRAMDADIKAMSGLIDDLLLISRLETGAIEPHRVSVDLAEIADEAVEVVAPMAARRGIIVTVEASGNTTVNGGPGELGRAVRNLLDNALRHSPDMARIKVMISNGGSDATLQVVDEGPGFGPAMLSTAFDEFTTGDSARRREGSGFGLGLAIVRTVVEAHGGSAWIEPGPGGRVAMRLPVAA
ncbi:MAG: HAMP domain-containing histidine kinase [Acidimicrobiia bacterium]|nr:HAMP domain-containing histidine kinase [Acidimicrobiia bacterium]